MTLDEIRTLVKQMAGDENGVLFTDTIVLKYINMSQKKLAAQLECLSASTTITSLDANGGALLPVNFYKPINVTWSGLQLFEVPIQHIRREGEELVTSTERPVGYCIFPYVATNITTRNPRMEFWPAATGSQSGLSIVINYVAYPTDLANTGDISALPELAHELILLMAVRMCKLQEDDYAAARELGNEIRLQLADVIASMHGTFTSFSKIHEHESTGYVYLDG